MFSRRHPYLFFMLILSAIVSSMVIFVSITLMVFKDDGETFSGEKVGIIEIKGAIADAGETLEQLKTFREDESIKAIVIRIDSPGGAVGPSQEIYREIKKTISEKKVVVSMGAVAASGGYYIAAAADGIVANPGTITGSIGVIMGFTNFEKLLKKIGLTPVVIKSGPYKDMGSPAREMGDEERKILQGITNDIHDQFVTAIAEGRNLDRDLVENIADGRIFTGEYAKNIGLVDKLGNFEDAVQWAGILAGIKGKVHTIYAKEEKLPLLRYLLESTLNYIGIKAVDPEIYAGYLYRPDTNFNKANP